MEKIFDIKVVKNVEVEFKKISKKLAPDPLNIDRLILNRLLHQIPDLPDNNKFNLSSYFFNITCNFYWHR